MLALYYLLFFAMPLASERPYESLEMIGVNQYAPWHCCQLCGPGPSWMNYSYIDGRCIENSIALQQDSRKQIYDQSISGNYPIATYYAQCCYFCGEAPGDYSYKMYNAETMDGYCEKKVSNDLKLSFSNPKCFVCRGLVSLVMTLLEESSEFFEAEIEEYCSITFFFRSFCRSLLKERVEDIRYGIEEKLSTGQICGNRLGLCPRADMPAPKSVESSLIEAGRAPTTILDPTEDGDTGPSEDLLTLLPLNSVNLNDFIGNGDAEGKLKTFKFLAKYSVILNSQYCKCGEESHKMGFIKDSKINDQYRWRCSECRKQEQIEKTSVRDGSFFAGKKLPVETILKVAAYWCHSPVMRIEDIAEQLGVSKNTVVELFQEFRDLAQVSFERAVNSQGRKLGGKGKYVEIDESLMFSAKYHKGAMLKRDPTWVFGMIERGTDDVAMFVVPRRDAATLLPLIQQHVEPETTVISDGWKAYGGIKNLQQQYNHLFVNHKLNFVDPSDPRVHTQSIEATWRALKTSLKTMYGVPKADIPTYLYQYMFKRKAKKMCLNYLLYEIGMYNPYDDSL